MLTHMDLVLKTGEDYPWDLVNAYQGESYTSQYHRLQERFKVLWKGGGDAPDFYSLKGWTEGWGCWVVDDERGRELERLVQERQW